MARLTWAAEYRDGGTGRHGERVARLCALLAERMGLPVDDVRRIEQASFLHDLGKIAVPDPILRNLDTLEPTERRIMQRHCVVGAQLLTGSRHPLLQEAERIARSHHERWDGLGYPDGLAGDAIPLSARITAVADAFDRLTELRSDRSAVTPEEALALVRADRGTHFDPAVVDALVALHGDGALETIAQTPTADEWKGSLQELAPMPKAIST